jgi:hypothetical protein
MIRPLLLAALLCSACSKAAAPANSSFTHIDVPGGTTIEQGGVRIEVADSVRYEYTSISTKPGTTASEATINGHAFGLREGAFFIGAHEFGPAPKGTVVRVSDAGVFVDGERRGATPAAAASR